MDNKNKKNIVLFADYPSGYKISKYLKKSDKIVALVFAKNKKNILNLNSEKKIKNIFRSNTKIYKWEDLLKKKNYLKLKKLKPDFFLSINFSKLIPKSIYEIPKKTLNLHLSYLPHNKGKNPNVWSIINNKPCGVTIHEIDSGIDTGKIVGRKKIIPEVIDTGETLWLKCNEEAYNLFKKIWPKYKNGKIKTIKQRKIHEKINYAKDFKSISEIKLLKKYSAEKLINILRAKTFNGFPGAIIKKKGKKIEIKLNLKYIK